MVVGYSRHTSVCLGVLSSSKITIVARRYPTTRNTKIRAKRAKEVWGSFPRNAQHFFTIARFKLLSVFPGEIPVSRVRLARTFAAVVWNMIHKKAMKAYKRIRRPERSGPGGGLHPQQLDFHRLKRERGKV
jgi:hypothetical protein